MRADPIELLDQPHHRIAALLDTGAPVYLSVNPVEYHGPHLSLHNDALVSSGLVGALHGRLLLDHPDWPLLVAADLEVGVDPARGRGTRVTPMAQVRRQLREATRALVELGVRRVVLVTFHGSPLHSAVLHQVAVELGARGVACYCPMSTLLWELLRSQPQDFEPMVAHVEDPALRRELLAGLGQDVHGGFIETSLSLCFAPDSVSSELARVPPCPAAPIPGWVPRAQALCRGLGASALAEELGFLGLGLAWMEQRPFRGYTGMPHLARAEAGQWLARRMVERFAQEAQEVFDGAPPREPPLLWLRWLTLGGRLPQPAPVPQGVEL